MTVLAALLLAAVLVVAVLRPRGLPEATAAVPAAAVVVLVGVLSPSAALAEVARLALTVGFLAAILVLAHLADAEGVFAWTGSLLGSRRLFGRVFVVAAATTAVLSLDATVVLLTPVVVRAARRLRARPDPAAYACAHLANSASLLLPVSNLTNLLAFGTLQASGVSFLRFAALMALPWLVVLAVEYVGLRLVFRRELADAAAEPTPDPAPEPVPVPTVAVGVLVATLVGFAVAGPLGVEPVWVAVVGVVVLGVRALARRRTTPTRLLGAASPLFCLFVLALGVVVAAVGANGLGDLLGGLLPRTVDLPALLAVAALAAVLANLVNNLPATLLLLAALGPSPAAATALAVLIGVGVGPNLTYVGSLATLLWRRVMLAEGVPPSLTRFTVAGAVTTPAALVAGTAALWLVAS